MDWTFAVLDADPREYKRGKPSRHAELEILRCEMLMEASLKEDEIRQQLKDNANNLCLMDAAERQNLAAALLIQAELNREADNESKAARERADEEAARKLHAALNNERDNQAVAEKKVIQIEPDDVFVLQDPKAAGAPTKAEIEDRLELLAQALKILKEAQQNDGHPIQPLSLGS